MTSTLSAAADRARMKVRRRRAISVAVFLCCMLGATAIGGMATADGPVNWLAFYGWALPICIVIAVCTNLFKFVYDTAKDV